jgi:hypothetical protein
MSRKRRDNFIDLDIADRDRTSRLILQLKRARSLWPGLCPKQLELLRISNT